MSAPYVQGATIDFVDTIEKQGHHRQPQRHRLLRLRRLVQLRASPRRCTYEHTRIWLSYARTCATACRSIPPPSRLPVAGATFMVNST
jgi:hypothetical protein